VYPPSCEGLLCSCYIGVVNLTFFLKITDHGSYCENKAYILKKQQPVEVEAEAKDQNQQQPSPKEAFQTHPDSKTNTSTDFSSEINEESTLFGSERSTLTNDSIKLQEEKHEHGGKLETSFCSTLPSKKNKKKSNNDKVEKAAGTPSSSHSSSSSSQSPPFTKSKSYSSGASSILKTIFFKERSWEGLPGCMGLLGISSSSKNSNTVLGTSNSRWSYHNWSSLYICCII
jgi:hypothetical protein